MRGLRGTQVFHPLRQGPYTAPTVAGTADGLTSPQVLQRMTSRSISNEFHPTHASCLCADTGTTSLDFLFFPPRDRKESGAFSGKAVYWRDGVSLEW